MREWSSRPLCLIVLLSLPGTLGVVASAADDEAANTIVERFAAANAEQAVPDFQRHVMPLIGQLGCNGRQCHGSFQGRGGLQLSLFGYDFSQDHEALTGPSDSESGRRINPREPAESLLLRKATAAVDHEGGRRVEPGSWQYHVLRRWIALGGKGPQSTSTLDRLEVAPAVLTWPTQGPPRSLQVTAVWSDGTREVVTALARARSNDDAVAAVQAGRGTVEPVGFGDTHVVFFYDNGITAVPIRVADPNRPVLPWPDDPIGTPIDDRVHAQLRDLGIVPSPVCDDSEFLRRASIDLTGTLPEPQEVRRFLADSDPGKRIRKIEELLERPAFAAWWATKLCDFTGCNPAQQAELGQRTAQQWYLWMVRRLQEKTPYDKIVAGILLATSRESDQSYGDYAAEVSAYFRDEQPADFSSRELMPHYWSRRNLEDPESKGLAVAHSFLGIRLQCAQCHKHPWDQWTQEDFRQFSRFFAPVKFGVSPESREPYGQLAQQIGLRVRGENGAAVRDEHLVRARKGDVIPWREVYLQPPEREQQLELLRSGKVTIKAGGDPRRELMDWLRTPDNPWFARTIVNRVWASCFHAGIVNPPDDLNPANPPSNPELLDWLANQFVAHNYDLQWLLREITRSATWQRSARSNATNQNDRRHFSRAIPRRLPAEVVYDGIKQAVCGSDQHRNVREDLTRRAVGHLSMRMAGTYAMHVFGKPQRSGACDCERVNEPSLLQAIFLQNDPLVYLLLEESQWLDEIGRHTAADEQQLRAWIDEAWLRFVARPPRSPEIERALAHLQQAASPREGMEDLLWSLLNTREFVLNH